MYITYPPHLTYQLEASFSPVMQSFCPSNSQLMLLSLGAHPRERSFFVVYGVYWQVGVACNPCHIWATINLEVFSAVLGDLVTHPLYAPRVHAKEGSPKLSISLYAKHFQAHLGVVVVVVVVVVVTDTTGDSETGAPQ